MACLALAAPAAGAAPKQPDEGDASRKILAALDAYSPSKPDPKDLVALYQMRSSVQDAEIRDRLDELVAIGFVAAKRLDIYTRRIRPAMKDPARLEGQGLSECDVCGAKGRTTIKCGRCGGTGLCQVCKGAGKRRVNVDMQTLKGPTPAHQKPKEEFKDIPCTTCKGTGECPDCGGDGTKNPSCQKCGGTGKIWDAAAVNRLAMESYDALHAAIKLKVFEASIPESVATASADGIRFFAPVFRLGDRRVAALPARAVTGISGLSLFSRDKRPIPFSSILASPNRDLVLVDLAGSSIVPPLELANDASQFDTGRHIYAYGTSRENETALRLDGKVTAAGPAHIATTVDSKLLADCAPLVTDDGRLGGIFMYPMAEFNVSGAVSLMQDNGAALRLDNIIPSDFLAISVGDLNLRNIALTFAKRAVKAAEELLELENDALALRSRGISETVKRLDRAIAMLKGVTRWDVFMMEAASKELVGECEARARNLENRLAEIAAQEAAKRAAEREARKAAEEGIATGVVEVVAAPAIPEEKPGAGTERRQAKKAPKKQDGKPARKSEASREKESPEEGLFGGVDLNRVLVILAIAVAAITVIFILIGVIQDNQRKKKLSAPPQIPDFIREMKEYERKHPGKKKL